MQKLKMIAPKYLIQALPLLGIEIYPADGESEARQALANAVKLNEPALIFITERIASYLEEEIKALRENPEINLVLIPDNRGRLGLAAENINRLIKISMGAEVIFRK